jgi:hypothetical protein
MCWARVGGSGSGKIALSGSGMSCDVTRIVTLAALLAACESKAPTLGPAPLYAGGEASEFGGSLPLGYCPIEESVTSLALDRQDVASQLALAVGQHSVDLRWRKEFPDPAIRGFDEDTQLVVNVTPLAVEDVVCRTGGAGGHEAEGVDGSTLRRFQLGIELSTSDGAVRAEFSAPFYPVRDGTRQGQPMLLGGASLPLADVTGTLEIGVDPDLTDSTQTLSINLGFDGEAPRGSLVPIVTLTRPIFRGDKPRWSPVGGTFPPPSDDPSCDAGTLVPLDEPLASLGETPRAAYEAVRARFPSAPIQGIWVEELESPTDVGDLPWADVTLRLGEPLRACASDGNVDIYGTLLVQTDDSRMRAEPEVVTTIGRPLVSSGQRDDFWLTMRARSGWMLPAEFEPMAGVRDLELGEAEYARFSLYAQLSSEVDLLTGDFELVKWEDYFARAVGGTALHWCSGPDCARRWCQQATASEAACE